MHSHYLIWKYFRTLLIWHTNKEISLTFDGALNCRAQGVKEQVPLKGTCNHPDTKNATVWSRSSCQKCFPHPSLYPLPSRHEECDHMVAFFMSGMFPTPQTCKRDPSVAFFVSGVSLHPLPSISPTSPWPRHENCDQVVTIFVSGVFPHTEPLSTFDCPWVSTLGIFLFRLFPY